MSRLYDTQLLLRIDATTSERLGLLAATNGHSASEEARLAILAHLKRLEASEREQRDHQAV